MENIKTKILEIIEADARLSSNKIATMLGRPAEEIAALIAEMEADGTILG